jgi:hypothetical protein
MRDAEVAKTACACLSRGIERIVIGWEIEGGVEYEVVGVFCADCRRKRGGYRRKNEKVGSR